MLRLAYANSVSVAAYVVRFLSCLRLRAQPLESSLGRVPQAADLICARTSNNRIVSVAEDCLSPERTFHGCPLMHGLKCGSCRIWQRTDLPPDSNMLRAEIQRALRRAPRQLRRLARLANSPKFKSFRCPRWRIKFSLERFSDPSRYSLRAQPLESSLGRVPQAAD